MYIDWTRVTWLFLQRPSMWWVSEVIPHLSGRFSGHFAIFGDVWSDCRWLDISPMPSCWWYPKLAILPCATSLRRPPMREEGPFFLPPKPFQRGVECENCARKIGGSYIYILYIYILFFWGAFHVSELQGVYKVGVCDPSLPTRSIRVSYVSCLFQRTLAWTSEGQQRRCLCGCGSKILETRDEGYRILTNPFLTPLSYTQLFSFFLFGWVVGSPNALDLLGCRCFLRYGFSWRVGHAPVPP
jgi:hypothetical protein